MHCIYKFQTEGPSRASTNTLVTLHRAATAVYRDHEGSEAKRACSAYRVSREVSSSKNTVSKDTQGLRDAC